MKWVNDLHDVVCNIAIYDDLGDLRSRYSNVYFIWNCFIDTFK